MDEDRKPCRGRPKGKGNEEKPPEEELLPGELTVEQARKLANISPVRIHQLIRARRLRARVIQHTGARSIYVINGESFREWMRERQARIEETETKSERPGRTAAVIASA